MTGPTATCCGGTPWMPSSSGQQTAGVQLVWAVHQSDALHNCQSQGNDTSASAPAACPVMQPVAITRLWPSLVGPPTACRFPLVAIAPEATTKAQPCLLTFRRGAFVAGHPVCPVLLRYRFKHFNPCEQRQAEAGCGW